MADAGRDWPVDFIFMGNANVDSSENDLCNHIYTTFNGMPCNTGVSLYVQVQDQTASDGTPGHSPTG